MHPILILLLFSITINMLAFSFAFQYQTDKLTDITYSITFILLTSFAVYFYGQSDLDYLVLGLISIWSIRLGSYLFLRINKMKKDDRFDDMRGTFGSFIKFWLLQAVSVWIILLPSLFFILSDSKEILWFGAIIWLVGLLIEAVADHQKYSFKLKEENKGEFIKSGLWKYSRHPNYFGEILCWIGIYVLTIPALSTQQNLIGLISPIFIIALLLFVSGIPLLEKASDEKYGHRKDYLDYKKNTNILIPGFKK